MSKLNHKVQRKEADVMKVKRKNYIKIRSFVNFDLTHTLDIS